MSEFKRLFDELPDQTPLPDKMKIGEKYDQVSLVKTEPEARALFERLVKHTMRVHGQTREEAEGLERHNIGYYAGYFGHETRLRVEELFKCAHPILPPAKDGQLSPEEAFELGKKWGAKSIEKGESDEVQNRLAKKE